MRLGLDMGTNSIGWCLYKLDSGQPIDIIDTGVRIFSDGRDPKSKNSLAIERRIARSARRRRDRFLRRRNSLMRKLGNSGLMPERPEDQKKLENLDPYALRARALDHPLTLHEIGRAIFHINQRRGFKSNRKTDRLDNESGKIAGGTARLETAMMTSGARTYGEFLHKRREGASDQRHVPSVRTRMTLRLNSETGKEEMEYDFYPSRGLMEEEFSRIWQEQAKHHDILSDELHDILFETVFYQRPLAKPKVGRCLFYYDEERLPKAHPLFQERILLETVNSLRIQESGQVSRPLSKDERDVILLQLRSKTCKTLSSATISFQALGKTIGLSKQHQFTLETENRKGIACDQVRAILMHKDRFGSAWASLSWQEQWKIITRKQDIESQEQYDDLVEWLCSQYHLSTDQAKNTVEAPLPQGYGRLGLRATEDLLPELRDEVIPYSEAIHRIFGSHSDFSTGEVLEELPYYGAILDRHVIPGTSDPNDDDITRYGRITNPTVHIGLNQLRLLINRIIKRYGLPEEIVVELARELKMNDKEKTKFNQTLRQNTKAAFERASKLEELGQRNTGHNRMLLRLWEELSNDPMTRFCPYSGKRITIEMLFDGSCDVDHILPYSRTLDDSFANRTLCLLQKNREKGNQSPWECWGNTSAWEKIEEVLPNLPFNKKWRFAPDAMERFESDCNFLDRQLNDTQYLSRIAREYLSRLYPDPTTSPVYVLPGRMTEMLRRHWGLNFDLNDAETKTVQAKNRSDHRHHAIDAAVIGATDRGLIQKIQTIAGKRRDQALEQIIGDIPEPFNGFRKQLRNKLSDIIISHRTDHGRISETDKKLGKDSTTGQLHNETAYGLTEEKSSTGVPMVVTRKPLLSLSASDMDKIRDRDLFEQLWSATRDCQDKGSEAQFKTALMEFSNKPGPYQGIRRVRLIQALKTIPIHDQSGRAYKGYKGDSNHCYEIWRMPDGNWAREVYTTYEAHQPNLVKKPHPAAKRIMRLYKKDILMLDHPKAMNTPLVIAKLSEQRLDLVPHNEADVDRRVRDKNDPLDYIRVSVSSLQKLNARKIAVNELGKIRQNR